MFAFTIFESIFLGVVCAFYQLDEILFAVAITLGVSASLILFASQTKVDFTSNAKQHKAVQSKATQCKAVQVNTKEYKAMQSSAKQCTAMQSKAEQRKAVQSGAKQCKAMPCGA